MQMIHFWTLESLHFWHGWFLDLVSQKLSDLVWRTCCTQRSPLWASSLKLHHLLRSRRRTQTHTNMTAHGSVGLYYLTSARSVSCVFVNHNVSFYLVWVKRVAVLWCRKCCMCLNVNSSASLIRRTVWGCVVCDCSCLFSFRVVDFLKSEWSMAHVYDWNQDNKASLSHTQKHTLCHGNKGNKHHPSPALQPSRCFTQNNKIQSTEHNGCSVSNTEQQLNVYATLYLFLTALQWAPCWDYPTLNTV